MFYKIIKKLSISKNDVETLKIREEKISHLHENIQQFENVNDGNFDLKKLLSLKAYTILI